MARFFLLVGAILGIGWPVLSGSTALALEVTPEMILGDYRSDPLFGTAAAQETVVIEVENHRVVPARLTLPAQTITRILFQNQSDQTHLMVIAEDLQTLLDDPEFLSAYTDSERKSAAPGHGGHHHGTSSNSADDAAPIVKSPDEHPALSLPPGEQKEVLMRFPPGVNVVYACLLDQHYQTGVMGFINIEPRVEEPIPLSSSPDSP
ncbi:MAG: hypothetical protein MI864_18805 [Pseudomonadales bacterium]|uniref:Copper-binding protein n=1 Tax=Oleiphilus messinensis TaxID=141451 RepID=A0A1Y0IF98_9GAMM|nr:cupredoxin domain-containing protein [Oleiphilus messinensis]ARU59151.1 copper-binding protein [Oleiphilus messinensis]MCG8612566.1 hypothetical protein [Pseudomonadales bacterium]